MMTRREFVAAAAAAPFLRQDGKTWRACVIGDTKRGGYGHGLDVCFQKIPNVKVVAVADPDEKGRAAAAKKVGVEKTYADWREMLAKEKPEVVSYGPRWVERRLEMMTACAEAGASVYMEKPIAGSMEEADAMVAIAEKAGIRVSVAHQVRPSPAVAYAKKRIEEGLIGDLLEIRTRGKEDARAGGEDLMVLGTHCLYLMRFFAGEPSWCTARVMQDGRDVTVADRRAATEPLGPIAGNSIQATYAFSKGVHGHFASQKSAHGPGGRFSIALYGSKGALQFAIGADPKIWHLADPKWSPGDSGAAWKPLEGAPSNDDPSGLKGPEASNKRIVEELLRAAESKGQTSVSLPEARATLEMIMAVYAAHLSGARATFPLKDRKHPLGTL